MTSVIFHIINLTKLLQDRMIVPLLVIGGGPLPDSTGVNTGHTKYLISLSPSFGLIVCDYILSTIYLHTYLHAVRLQWISNKT